MHLHFMGPLSNVLDIRGEGVGGGVPLQRHDCSTRGGVSFMLTPRGRVWAGTSVHGRDLFEILEEKTHVTPRGRV